MQLTALTVATSVLAASAMAGGQSTVITESGQTAAVTLTTDTASNIIARLQNAVAAQLASAGLQQYPGVSPGTPNLVNLTYLLTIVNNNTSAGAITLAAGTGVTLSAGAAIAITTSVMYQVTITGPNSLTITRLFSGGV